MKKIGKTLLLGTILMTGACATSKTFWSGSSDGTRDTSACLGAKMLDGMEVAPASTAKSELWGEKMKSLMQSGIKNAQEWMARNKAPVCEVEHPLGLMLLTAEMSNKSSLSYAEGLSHLTKALDLKVPMEKEIAELQRALSGMSDGSLANMQKGIDVAKRVGDDAAKIKQKLDELEENDHLSDDALSALADAEASMEKGAYFMSQIVAGSGLMGLWWRQASTKDKLELFAGYLTAAEKKKAKEGEPEIEDVMLRLVSLVDSVRSVGSTVQSIPVTEIRTRSVTDDSQAVRIRERIEQNGAPVAKAEVKERVAAIKEQYGAYSFAAATQSNP